MRVGAAMTQCATDIGSGLSLPDPGIGDNRLPLAVVMPAKNATPNINTSPAMNKAAIMTRMALFW